MYAGVRGVRGSAHEPGGVDTDFDAAMPDVIAGAIAEEMGGPTSHAPWRRMEPIARQV
jgi:hypothetical protein